MIHYQAAPGSGPRSGVAPHVDFSWITLVLQDDAGGLQVRTPAGEWLPAPPVAGRMLVNIGEILAFSTGGCCTATPHCVSLPPAGCARISLPFFLNPGLATTVAPVLAGREAQPSHADAAHVHRVFPVLPTDPFVFGDEEWWRKGLGVYCAECVTHPPRNAGGTAARRDR
jgi:isopenicillin N synthase-like dioxygenase